MMVDVYVTLWRVMTTFLGSVLISYKIKHRQKRNPLNADTANSKRVILKKNILLGNFKLLYPHFQGCTYQLPQVWSSGIQKLLCQTTICFDSVK